MSHRSKNIFLIEDNPGDVVLFKEALKECHSDMQLSVTNNGKLAIEQIKNFISDSSSYAPDIIFLDLNLPGQNGPAILSELKSDPELKTIPVIILTSSEMPQDIKLSYQLNANCYITKPANFEDYMRILSSVEEFWFNIVRLK